MYTNLKKNHIVSNEVNRAKYKRSRYLFMKYGGQRGLSNRVQVSQSRKNEGELNDISPL